MIFFSFLSFRFLSLLFFISALFGDFGSETLVKVPDRYQPISQLLVDDTIISSNEDGDYIYVDRAHCDYLEVFGKDGWGRIVLNFKGLEIASKIKQVKNRKI